MITYQWTRYHYGDERNAVNSSWYIRLYQTKVIISYMRWYIEIIIREQIEVMVIISINESRSYTIWWNHVFWKMI